jgi:hypothetical protein
MMDQYSAAMEILQKHSDYTDEDIDLFQDLIDNFYEKYISQTPSRVGKLCIQNTSKFFSDTRNKVGTMENFMTKMCATTYFPS